MGLTCLGGQGLAKWSGGSGFTGGGVMSSGGGLGKVTVVSLGSGGGVGEAGGRGVRCGAIGGVSWVGRTTPGSPGLGLDGSCSPRIGPGDWPWRLEDTR